MNEWENKIYGKELLCKFCGSHKFGILLNVYTNDLIIHPHFEIVCLNCRYGFVLIPNSKEFEKYLKNIDLNHNLKVSKYGIKESIKKLRRLKK